MPFCNSHGRYAEGLFSSGCPQCQNVEEERREHDRHVEENLEKQGRAAEAAREEHRAIAEEQQWAMDDRLAEHERALEEANEELLERQKENLANRWKYEAESQLDEAEKAYKVDNYPDALNLASRAIKNHPTSIRGQELIGQIYLRMGSYQYAERAFLASARLAEGEDIKKTAAGGYLYAGFAAFRRGAMDSAISHTERAIVLDPTRKDAYFSLAKFQANLRRPNLAMPHLLKALQLDPAYAAEAGTDEDLDPYAREVNALIAQERDRIKPDVQKALNDARARITELRRLTVGKFKLLELANRDLVREAGMLDEAAASLTMNTLLGVALAGNLLAKLDMPAMHKAIIDSATANAKQKLSAIAAQTKELEKAHEKRAQKLGMNVAIVVPVATVIISGFVIVDHWQKYVGHDVERFFSTVWWVIGAAFWVIVSVGIGIAAALAIESSSVGSTPESSRLAKDAGDLQEALSYLAKLVLEPQVSQPPADVRSKPPQGRPVRETTFSRKFGKAFVAIAIPAILIFAIGFGVWNSSRKPDISSGPSDSGRARESKSVPHQPARREYASQPDARPLSNFHVGLLGIGPVRVGMTPEEAGVAIGRPLVRKTVPHSNCDWRVLGDGNDGVAWMVVDGRIATSRIWRPGVQTRSGVQVGDPETKVMQAYPGYIEVSERKYSGGPHQLIFTPKDPTDQAYRVVFLTDRVTVQEIQAGRHPEVEYSCAEDNQSRLK